jgi:hypothetical protein
VPLSCPCQAFSQPAGPYALSGRPFPAVDPGHHK